MWRSGGVAAEDKASAEVKEGTIEGQLVDLRFLGEQNFDIEVIS